MLNICLTFDYELFFNKSYASEKEVLIDTSEMLINVMRERKVKGTFFIDVPSILKYKEEGLINFPNMVEKQIGQFLKEGHDVELHMHPIWYQAQYLNGNWIFNNDYYRFDQYDLNSLNLEKKFYDSKSYLERICRNYDSEYKCIAYRAGGFCLSPQKEVLPILRKIGIKIDSSVCNGTWLDSKSINYDFRKSPNKLNWWIKGITDVCVENDEENNNEMLEISIGTYKNIPKKWILTHGMPKLNYPALKGEKTPVILQEDKKIKKILKRVEKSYKMPILFTLDSLHYKSLYYIVQEYVKQYDAYNNDVYVAAIGHPKFVSEAYAKNLNKFIFLIQKSKLPVKFIRVCDAIE